MKSEEFGAEKSKGLHEWVFTSEHTEVVDKFFDEKGKFNPKLFAAKTSQGFLIPCTLKELMSVYSKIGVTLHGSLDVLCVQDMEVLLGGSFKVWNYRECPQELVEEVTARFSPVFAMEKIEKKFIESFSSMWDVEFEIRNISEQYCPEEKPSPRVF
jgi:hypothetical protein